MQMVLIHRYLQKAFEIYPDVKLIVVAHLYGAPGKIGEIGILLPVLFHRTFRWRQGLLIGVLLSSVIEITQLVSCRGLFEWDDMLHNGIGCMLGCLLADLVIRVRIGPAS